MKSPMVNVTRFTMLCLWPMVMSAHAFASTSTAILAPATSSSLSLRRHGPLAPFHGHNANEIYGRNLNNKFTHDNIKYNRRSSSSGSSLHLHPAKAKAIAELIPRGGASASAAIAGVGATLSQWSSTPNGAFNMALAVLAASTAVLKIGNRESGEGGADGAAVTVSFRDYNLFMLGTFLLLQYWTSLLSEFRSWCILILAKSFENFSLRNQLAKNNSQLTNNRFHFYFSTSVY